MASLEDKSIWEDGQVNGWKMIISFLSELMTAIYVIRLMHNSLDNLIACFTDNLLVLISLSHTCLLKAKILLFQSMKNFIVPKETHKNKLTVNQHIAVTV